MYLFEYSVECRHIIFKTNFLILFLLIHFLTHFREEKPCGF